MNTNLAIKPVYFSKLTKEEKLVVENIVKNTPALRNELRTRSGCYTFTFEYDGEMIEKVIELPARFTWPKEIKTGKVFMPVEKEDESFSTSSTKSNSSKDEKTEEEKCAEKREKAREETRRSISRAIFSLIITSAVTVIIAFAFGMHGKMKATSNKIESHNNSYNAGFIDCDGDGVRDADADAKAASDPYLRNIEIINGIRRP